MDYNFAAYLRQLQVEHDVKSRTLAQTIGVTESYWCDIRNGRKYPPQESVLTKIAETLGLNKTESNHFMDLAAKERGVLARDITDYIMASNNVQVRAVLRKARDLQLDDAFWQDVLHLIKKEESGGKEDGKVPCNRGIPVWPVPEM